VIGIQITKVKVESKTTFLEKQA